MEWLGAPLASPWGTAGLLGVTRVQADSAPHPLTPRWADLAAPTVPVSFALRSLVSHLPACGLSKPGCPTL